LRGANESLILFVLPKKPGKGPRIDKWKRSQKKKETSPPREGGRQ